jgi:phosphoribosyl 1,2-cyclic phosphodiesterase
MSLFIASLNSGSNGNCYYVGNHSEAVLVDAGLSCRETEKRMAKLNLAMGKVKAIFVSHEHGDHIMGLPVLSKKYKLPVYISTATLHNSGMILQKELLRPINTEPVVIGALRVTAFEKMHDAADPYSFIVESNGVKVGVLTDIGKVCKQVVHYFRQCHAVFLESNYDEQMLETGGYPQRLQKRISGGKGHLSNAQALDLFVSHRAPYMSHLILSHLSENNNLPELALDLFSPFADEVTVTVASREMESPVYHIQGNGKDSALSKKLLPYRTLQYSLFE